MSKRSRSVSSATSFGASAAPAEPERRRRALPATIGGRRATDRSRPTRRPRTSRSTCDSPSAAASSSARRVYAARRGRWPGPARRARRTSATAASRASADPRRPAGTRARRARAPCRPASHRPPGLRRRPELAAEHQEREPGDDRHGGHDLARQRVACPPGADDEPRQRPAPEGRPPQPRGPRFGKQRQVEHAEQEGQPPERSGAPASSESKNRGRCWPRAALRRATRA